MSNVKIRIHRKVTRPYESSTWRAILIDAKTQAGKTKKCFELLNTKLALFPENDHTLILFVTQANSITSVNQIIQRVKNQFPELKDAVYKSNCVPKNFAGKTCMIVDFWNSRNMNNMIDFVQDTYDTWANIIIVIDEIEQAGFKGVRDRLLFIKSIEEVAMDIQIRAVFITATIANLSKCILEIGLKDESTFGSGVVHDIISNNVVEHYYAVPHPSYVGASWFQTTPGVWRKLVFPPKKQTAKEDYQDLQLDIVLKEIESLPQKAKELSLIVTSTRTEDHTSLAERLYQVGYNVTVELNGKNNKNYKVNYVTTDGSVSSWIIPYTQIDSYAERGSLKTLWNSRNRIETGITQKEDYTLSHILQAALFMRTDEQERIQTHVNNKEYMILDALVYAMLNMLPPNLRRPNDYPGNPKVALIAGHLAGRGITIQNPSIDFTCTSFCFTHIRDSTQRGATNTQRFGRACGMLGDVFARDGRKPILISTETMMKDAVANELAVIEKASEFPDGSVIKLKDMITDDDWKQLMKKTVTILNTPRESVQIVYTRESALKKILEIIKNSEEEVANMSWSKLSKIDESLSNYMRRHHNKLLNDMQADGLVINVKKSHWKLLQRGQNMLMFLSNSLDNP